MLWSYNICGYLRCKMKIWLDDLRPAPEGFVHCHSVNEAKDLIRACELFKDKGMKVSGFQEFMLEDCVIELLDLDHDLGDYAKDGGDGIELVKYLALHQYHYPVKLHTANPVGRDNMQYWVDKYINPKY